MAIKIDNMVNINTVVGDACMYCILCKIANEAEGWVKTTLAYEIINIGCVVLVSTQQKNDDKTYALSETSVFVPGVSIAQCINGGNKLVENRARRL